MIDNKKVGIETKETELENNAEYIIEASAGEDPSKLNSDLSSLEKELEGLSQQSVKETKNWNSLVKSIEKYRSFPGSVLLIFMNEEKLIKEVEGVSQKIQALKDTIKEINRKIEIKNTLLEKQEGS